MKNLIIIIFLILIVPAKITNRAMAELLFRDNFQDTTQWRFVSDEVMGGRSSGSVAYAKKNGMHIALLSGNVTTENNGGFIQIRKDLQNIDLKKARFLKITAKGNNQKYFIHLRTSWMMFPWQYYQTEFYVRRAFKEFNIPISQFRRSDFLLSKSITPKNIISIGLVAFGRDHRAELSVKEIAFYK
ncbi:MAG: hypothetical protein CFH06_00393 [Alphaproteobacteria bacterium MarineAlpha3_Bin5]|nr:hypothetical protein [Magnetovibrio sp.]PPR79362.1 MAG: hypothetical protein CFH06_00393 [Alphaproteobacteria bacterium MarineAlpha3_Bin5]